MRVGFMTNFLVKSGMKNFDELAAWAVENGFQDLEVGPTVPLDEKLYASVLEKHNIKITSLTYCRNYLSTDKEEAETHIAELKKRILFAQKLGIEKIVTSTGIDKSIEENVYDRADSIRRTPIRSLDKFVETFTPIAELAEQCGVKIAFENCPLMGNIAISPVMWRAIFEKLPSNNIGLAYDPSHLIWEFIDPYAPIAEFKDKIFHIHAKDTRINREKLAECGFLTDFSWWNYRIPGRGELDWARFFEELNKIGYDKTISIEHEDADYESSLELVQEGLIKGRKFLEQFIKEQ